jgi:two-component sensor histidine kinase
LMLPLSSKTMSCGRVVQVLMVNLFSHAFKSQYSGQCRVGLRKYEPYSNYPLAMANSPTRWCMSIGFALYMIRNSCPTAFCVRR